MHNTEKSSPVAGARKRHPALEVASAGGSKEHLAGKGLHSKRTAAARPRSETGRARQWFVVRDAFLSTTAARQIEQIREGLDARNLVGAAEALGVSQETIFGMVGLAASTAKRKVAMAEMLDPSASERLARIGAIEKQAEETFGDQARAAQWLRTANVGLGNFAPLSMLDTDIGCREISRMLNAIAYGGVA